MTGKIEKPEQPYLAAIFEDNYLRRTHKNLTSNPIVALTELVANAWDAGALNVRITIPSACGEEIKVEDDGTGMTEEEFQSRWLTLSYN
ncbi:MAG: ATP-binding protein, partial [Victivallales bacterium]|nr:ATP-binding protein [Victivallales bacterium]